MVVFRMGSGACRAAGQAGRFSALVLDTAHTINSGGQSVVRTAQVSCQRNPGSDHHRILDNPATAPAQDFSDLSPYSGIPCRLSTGGTPAGLKPDRLSRPGTAG
jgi:hypothetical protein